MWTQSQKIIIVPVLHASPAQRAATHQSSPSMSYSLPAALRKAFTSADVLAWCASQSGSRGQHHQHHLEMPTLLGPSLDLLIQNLHFNNISGFVGTAHLRSAAQACFRSLGPTCDFLTFFWLVLRWRHPFSITPNSNIFSGGSSL